MQIIHDQSLTSILNFTDWWVIRKVWNTQGNIICKKELNKDAGLCLNWQPKLFSRISSVLFSTTCLISLNLVISNLQGWKKSTTSKSLSFLTASNVLSVRAGTWSLNVEVTLALRTVADTSSSSVSSAEKV